MLIGLVLSGCAGRQLRDLREQVEFLERENAELVSRLETATAESMRLSREVSALLERHGEWSEIEDLQQRYVSLREQNDELRRLLAEAVSLALDNAAPLPDDLLAATEELQLFRSELRDIDLPRDTGGTFASVADVTAAQLSAPDPRSPLANSGIVFEERDAIRYYYDAIINRTTPQAFYLTIVLAAGRAPELHLVINERYPRTEPPLAFRRVRVNGDSGSIALPIATGRVSRTQDDEYRFETASFSFNTAVEAAVRVAIESRFPVLELGGIGSVAQRPISDRELTALTNVLYAYNTMAASAAR